MMHPMHAILLTNTAAELFVAIQAHPGTAGDARDMEQAARMALRLEALTNAGARFAHPAETMGRVKTATTLLVGRMASVGVLDAAQESALVEQAVSQSALLTAAVMAGHKKIRDARRSAKDDPPALPAGVRIEKGDTPPPPRPRR